MTSTFSTIANFSTLQVMQRTSRIDLLNRIGRIEMKHFNFPRTDKHEPSSYYPLQDKNRNVPVILPNLNEIIIEIEHAKVEASNYARTLGVVVSTELICDISWIKKSPDENNGDGVNATQNAQNNANIDYTETPKTSISGPSNENHGNEILRFYKNIQLKKFGEKIDLSSIAENDQHVIVQNDDGRRICIKKHSLCWLMSKCNPKISSDRLYRFKKIESYMIPK